eukprot:ctg_165.g72
MLLGRPNVGKSTLFNRLCGRRTSLVDNRPGCTRDVVEDVGRLSDLRFRLLDTPGLELSLYRRGVARSALAADPRHHQVFSKFATDFSGDDAVAALCQQMCARTERLLERYRDPARNPAGLLALFVIDAVQGVMPGDREMVELLRRKTVPSVLALNKCDAARAAVGHVEACAELGYDDCAAISAEQELGWADLYEALQPHVDAMNEVDAADTVVEEPPVAISVVGRPNVGKSTLLNALVGADRFLTAPFAGVTRDAVTAQSERFPNVLFTDTAGMRLLSSQTSTDRLQAEANQMARSSMRKANVCCLLLDAGLVEQATRETGSLRGALTDIEIKIIYEAAAAGVARRRCAPGGIGAGAGARLCARCARLPGVAAERAAPHRCRRLRPSRHGALAAPPVVNARAHCHLFVLAARIRRAPPAAAGAHVCFRQAEHHAAAGVHHLRHPGNGAAHQLPASAHQRQQGHFRPGASAGPGAFLEPTAEMTSLARQSRIETATKVLTWHASRPVPPDGAERRPTSPGNPAVAPAQIRCIKSPVERAARPTRWPASGARTAARAAD